MSILASLEPFTARDGTMRFTPGTITLLTQDPQTKELSSGSDPGLDAERRPTTRLRQQRPGVALGAPGGEDLDHGVGHLAGTRLSPAHRHGRDADDHVQPLPAEHPLRPLLEPQSQYLIDFDFVLLTTLFSKISPPTPVSGPMALLTLVDRFAENRTFFDDDPHAELKKRGLEAGLHEEEGLGPVPAGGVATRHLEDHT